MNAAGQPSIQGKYSASLMDQHHETLLCLPSRSLLPPTGRSANLRLYLRLTSGRGQQTTGVNEY